ncbi:protein wech-like isoform X2 [Panonychus citri]|nr:protein wech-like isoform X2 [Panonychus citri]
MEDVKSKSEFSNDYQIMVQELQNDLDDLSLNKDAVEQAINEQYHSIKAALDKCYKQMLDDLGRVHNQKRMQLWGQIDRCEKISEKLSNHHANQNDGLIEDFGDGHESNGQRNGTTSSNGSGNSFVSGGDGTTSKDVSGSDFLTCSLTDKSNSSPTSSSFLDFGRESSPVGINLKNLKNGKGDQIVFNPVDLTNVEPVLISNLFGNLKVKGCNDSDLEDTPCFQSSDFTFPDSDLTTTPLHATAPGTPSARSLPHHSTSIPIVGSAPIQSLRRRGPPSLSNDNNLSDSLHAHSFGHNNTITSLPGASPVSLPRSGPIAVPTNSNSNHLDLNDYITRVNLTKLALYNENPAAAAAVVQPRLSSISSSISNSPSPQPLISNSLVPYENSSLALGDNSVNNLNEMAKFSSNPTNGIENQPSSNSFPFRSGSAPTTGPLVSPVPPSSIHSSINPNKGNVMQIRCKFGSLGAATGFFSSPHGFCLGVDEDIVIADTNNHRICVYNKSGDFKFQFGEQGKDEGQLWYPRKVAMIRTPYLGIVTPRYVVCDRGVERSRMQIFTCKGQFIRKIGVRYIDIVAGLAITPKGLIVAVDSVSPTVFVIAESGELLRWFDCSPYMREPSDIAVNGKEFYVCDFKGSCVVVFGEDGKFKRRIGKEKITDYPNGIDFSDAGDILVGDSHGNRFHVVVFDKSGNFISEFECPYVKVSRCCGLKITSEGYIVTLAKNNHHVLVLNTLYVN